MDGLYDTDILLWSERQAELLRRLARGERVNDALDFENLIEEVESVGRSELHAVESLLRVALTHLLLAHGAPRRDAVNHWRVEALTALSDAARRVTPGMRPRLDLVGIWALARRIARAKLEGDPGVRPEPLPASCPFTLEELLSNTAEPLALVARLEPAPPPG